MQRTWNFTYYRDGEPAGERRGVSQQDAAVELYRLARGEARAASAAVEAEPEQVAAPAETGELSLAA